MDTTGVVPLRFELDGAVLGAANNNPSASPSPGVLSASIVTTASPYPIAASSASSMQLMSSDAPLGREPKRPRIIRRQSSAISGTQTNNLSDRSEHQSIDGAHERLDINYSQDLDRSSQSSSAMAVVTPSTMPTDTYPVVGTPYWSNNPLGAGAMDKSNQENGDANHGHGGGEAQIHSGAQSQMYGNGVTWNQEIQMPMNPMQQYVPRRMASGSWESDPQHHQQSHQLQQSHQQMQPDGSLASPYESSSAASNHPQMYSDYPIVNGTTHHIVPSNSYANPGGNSTPTTPHQAPSTVAGWPQSSFHGAAGGATTIRSSSRLGGTAGLGKDVKPKILASSTSSLPRRSPIQQSAVTANKSERAKSGDRTTHNDVERKYRTNLKDRIAELRAAVPALQALQDGESDGTTTTGAAGAPKVSKGTVLSKATEYIQQLEQANRTMANEHQQLMERLHTLEAMIQNGQGGGNGARPPPQYTPHHGMAMFDPRGFS